MLKRTVIPVLLLFAVVANVFASEALEQLDKASKAVKSTNYNGRFVVTGGNDIRSMQISHAVIDGVEYEKLASLTGIPSEIIRIGEERLSLRVDARLANYNGGLLQAFSGDFRNLSEDILALYDVSVRENAMVAGKPATRIVIRPKDQHRFGYAVWIDDASGIILKSGMLRGDGHFLKVFEFVDLNELKKVDKSHFEPSLQGEYKPTRVSTSAQPALRGDAHAPVSPVWLPEGFSRTSHSRDESSDGVVHSELFSDGLAAFTFFVVESQEGQKKARLSRMGPTIAATRQLARDGKFYDVTLVGELPVKTVKKILQALDQ